MQTSTVDIEMFKQQPKPSPKRCTAASASLPCLLSTATLLATLVACGGVVITIIKVYSIEDAKQVLEPPLLGVMPGKARPKIVLAQDVDWPPYAYVAVPPEGDYDVAGFGHDVAKGLESVCDIDVVTRQAAWSECWGDNKIGSELDDGVFHGCMTYTHTAGTRGRYLDFSYGILSANKPAGILTRLGTDGKPVLDPLSDLSGKKIVDVKGWAPTADGLSLVTNWCTGSRYSGYTVLTPTEDGNDAAMTMLRNGEADGMFVYADQAYNYRPGQADITPTWNEALWTGLGTKFAYIGTGMLGHSYNGTTLAISKKGSGLNDILNPCLQKYMETASYYDVCKKHDFEASCYPNAHFPTVESTSKPWAQKTNEHPAGGCSAGYCECSVGVTTGTDTLLR